LGSWLQWIWPSGRQEDALRGGRRTEWQEAAVSGGLAEAAVSEVRPREHSQGQPRRQHEQERRRQEDED
jgi:predicted transcriptional regulator